MNRFLLSTFQTFVCVFVVSAVSLVAKAGTTNSQTANPPAPAWPFSPPYNPDQACDDLSKSIVNDYSDAQDYCADTPSAAACMSKLKNCAEQPEDTTDHSSDGDDPDDSTYCYPFGYQTYKSDLKDMKQTVKDDQKTLADLQKDAISAQKDYNEQKAKLAQSLQDATDDYNKQQLQDKADQRKEQTDQKAAQDSLHKQIRDLQMQILQAQNQQALLTSQRSTQIDDYKLKILQCKSDTQKYQAQVRNNTLGGLASLSVKGGGAASDVNTYWQTCVNKVLAQRTDDANKYSVAMSQLSAQITQAQQELNDSQQSMQLMQKQAQQQAVDDMTKSQQALQSEQAKQRNTMQQMQDLSSTFQKQSAQLTQQIDQVRQDNNVDSNELKKFQGQTPPRTNTTSTDAYKALSKVNDECIEARKKNCAAASALSACSSAKTSPSPTSGAANAADGKKK